MRAKEVQSTRLAPSPTDPPTVQYTRKLPGNEKVARNVKYEHRKQIMNQKCKAMNRECERKVDCVTTIHLPINKKQAEPRT